MSSSLSASTIAIVKSTGPALRQHGVAITTAMYARLFQDAEVKAMFDQAAQALVQAKGWHEHGDLLVPQRPSAA